MSRQRDGESWHRPRWRGLGLLACILLLGAMSCAGGRAIARPDPLQPSTSPRHETTELEVQSAVMAMADAYSATLAEAMYLLVRSETVDPKGRWLAQSFLRNGMGAAIDIAAGPNPRVGLLDLLVLAALQSWAFENHWIAAGIGPAAGDKALSRLHAAETELWQSAGRVLSPTQIATLRDLVGRWIEAHPDQTVVSLVRFKEFTEQRRLPTMAAREAASGLLADVQEATAAVEDAQLLGERLIWFAGRIPYVLGQQIELTAYRIADQPEAALLRDSLPVLRDLARSLSERAETLDADLSSQQAELFSRLRDERTAALDDLASPVAAEREATVSLVFDRLARERTAFLDDLEARRLELGSTMNDLRETIAASSGLAQNLTRTAAAVDGVITRLVPAPGTDHAPLDLGDLTAAAAEASRTAEQLSELLERADKVLGAPHWQAQLERFESATTALVDRVFFWALLLVVSLVVGLAEPRLLTRRTG